MKFILINAENNYADEFDLEGFIVVKGEEAERALKLLEVFDKVPDQEINFGTNESVYLHHTSWEIKELSELEYNVIISTLGEQYGLLNVDYLLEAIEESSLFVEETRVFRKYIQDMQKALKPFDYDYFEFVKYIESLPSFLHDGVSFVKSKYFGSDSCFVVSKDHNGEEYSMSFEVRDYLSYSDY